MCVYVTIVEVGVSMISQSLCIPTYRTMVMCGCIVRTSYFLVYLYYYNVIDFRKLFSDNMNEIILNL